MKNLAKLHSLYADALLSLEAIREELHELFPQSEIPDEERDDETPLGPVPSEEESNLAEKVSRESDFDSLEPIDLILITEKLFEYERFLQ